MATFLVGMFRMWINNHNDREAWPLFTAVDPINNPLPSCLEEGRMRQNAKLPINDRFPGRNPGYLTLPGKFKAQKDF